ncbi:unnamed protein product [Urochloa humidicola]
MQGASGAHGRGRHDSSSGHEARAASSITLASSPESSAWPRSRPLPPAGPRQIRASGASRPWSSSVGSTSTSSASGHGGEWATAAVLLAVHSTSTSSPSAGLDSSWRILLLPPGTRRRRRCEAWSGAARRSRGGPGGEGDGRRAAASSRATRSGQRREEQQRTIPGIFAQRGGGSGLGGEAPAGRCRGAGGGAPGHQIEVNRSRIELARPSLVHLGGHPSSPRRSRPAAVSMSSPTPAAAASTRAWPALLFFLLSGRPCSSFSFPPGSGTSASGRLRVVGMAPSCADPGQHGGVVFYFCSL